MHYRGKLDGEDEMCYPKYGTEAAKKLPHTRYRSDITISHLQKNDHRYTEAESLSYRCHGDDGPPVCIKDVLETGVGIVLLKNKCKRSKHDCPDEEKEEQKTKFFHICRHCLS